MKPTFEPPRPCVAVDDPEIMAIEVCLKALLPLEAAARSRVLEYLDDRLEMTSAGGATIERGDG